MPKRVRIRAIRRKPIDAKRYAWAILALAKQLTEEEQAKAKQVPDAHDEAAS